MTSKKRPEQRSTAAERHPGQPAPQPTGDEVYTPRRRREAPEQPELTTEERAELEELERAAAEAYEQIGRAAERLSDQAVDVYQSGRTFVRDHPARTLFGSFVIGVVLGALMSKK